MGTSRKQLESDSIDNKYIIHNYFLQLIMFQNMYTAIPSIGGIAKVIGVRSWGQRANFKSLY